MSEALRVGLQSHRLRVCETREMHTQRKGQLRPRGWGTSTDAPRREAPGETTPADTSILDVQPVSAATSMALVTAA